MLRRVFGWLLASLLLLATAFALAQTPAPVPPLQARVTDSTGTLGAERAAALERQLAQFEVRKGTQIAVLIVPTTRPEAIEQYSLRVVEQWKLGRKKVDDGALLIVARDDRTLRIEVGYGLEGALNDATAGRIVREIIVPRFARGDLAGGIEAGTGAMMAVIDGEPLPAPGRNGGPQQEVPQYMPVLLVVALVAGALLRGLMGRLPASLATGAVVGGAAWLLVGVLSTTLLAAVLAALFTLAGGIGLMGALGGHHGGSLGRGGGGHGGGFRGGGGGFGGGGSTGRW